MGEPFGLLSKIISKKNQTALFVSILI